MSCFLFVFLVSFYVVVVVDFFAKLRGYLGKEIFIFFFAIIFFIQNTLNMVKILVFFLK